MLPREPIFHRNFPHTHRRSFTGSLAPPCSTNKRLRAILRACEKEDVDRDSTSSVHRRRSRKTEQTTDSDSWRWKSHSKTGQLSSRRHDFSLFSVRVPTVRSHLSCQTHERAQMNGAGNLRYDLLCRYMTSARDTWNDQSELLANLHPVARAARTLHSTAVVRDSQQQVSTVLPLDPCYAAGPLTFCRKFICITNPIRVIILSMKIRCRAHDGRIMHLFRNGLD